MIEQYNDEVPDIASVRMEHLAEDAREARQEAAAAAAEAGGPVPVMAGTFAIYEDGGGGYVLVTETAAGVDRKHIPPAIVKMATGGGLLGRKLSGLFGAG